MYSRYILVSLLLFIIIFSACASSQFGWQSEPTRSKKSDEEVSKYKEDFDPLLLKEDEIVVEPNETRAKPQQDFIALDVQQEPETINTEIQEVAGFCIQLFATGDEGNAREFKKNAMLKLSSDVYWVFESGMYKIRTGNSRTRKEAEVFLQDIRQKGNEFRDAWIVKARVKLQVEVPE